MSSILACYGCGRPYEKGPDLVVSDADWERIRPPDGCSQVLCPNCMHDAFEALGAPAGSVVATFRSGPFMEWRSQGDEAALRDKFMRLPLSEAMNIGFTMRLIDPEDANWNAADRRAEAFERAKTRRRLRDLAEYVSKAPFYRIIPDSDGGL